MAERTRALEERTETIEEVALDALAAARQWAGADAAIKRLAEELGVSPEEVRKEVERRR